MQKNYRLVEYIPFKCFKKFVQSVVNARREGNKNPNSSVVAETMKMFANSSYSYQIMDRSRHTVTKCEAMRKQMGLSTQNCSSIWITSRIYCMKYNWRRQRLSTENQSLLGFSYSNTLNLDR